MATHDCNRYIDGVVSKYLVPTTGKCTVCVYVMIDYKVDRIHNNLIQIENECSSGQRHIIKMLWAMDALIRLNKF